MFSQINFKKIKTSAFLIHAKPASCSLTLYAVDKKQNNLTAMCVVANGSLENWWRELRLYCLLYDFTLASFSQWKENYPTNWGSKHSALNVNFIISVILLYHCLTSSERPHTFHRKVTVSINNKLFAAQQVIMQYFRLSHASVFF